MLFFIAKVKRANGDLMHPLSLYAEDIEAAQSVVETSGLMGDGDTFEVGSIHLMHQELLARDVADGRGVVEHVEQTWSSDGPLQLIKLFGEDDNTTD